MSRISPCLLACLLKAYLLPSFLSSPLIDILRYFFYYYIIFIAFVNRILTFFKFSVRVVKNQRVERIRLPHRMEHDAGILEAEGIQTTGNRILPTNRNTGSGQPRRGRTPCRVHCAAAPQALKKLPVRRGLKQQAGSACSDWVSPSPKTASNYVGGCTAVPPAVKMGMEKAMIIRHRRQRGA